MCQRLAAQRYRHRACAWLGAALVAVQLTFPAVDAANSDDPDIKRLYARAQKALADGDTESALQRLQALARRDPRAESSALALWDIFRIHQHLGDDEAAFAALDDLIVRHPHHFERAYSEQFGLVQRLLASGTGSRRTLETVRPSQRVDPEVIISMLGTIIRTGPESAIGIQARYYLAVAMERAGKKEDAVAQYEDFLELHPRHELADDAAYQAAYIPYKDWRAGGSSGPKHRERAAMALTYFVTKYPESDKVAQARSCLSEVNSAEFRELRSLARYYASQGNAKASAIYYEQLALKFPRTVIQDPELQKEITAAGRAETARRP